MENKTENLNRKDRRVARREKQRHANVGRALKMHVARIANSNSSFTTRKSPDALKSSYYIGCSGWFYWQSRGLFYPQSLPTKQWFQYYASRFKTVELNAPFYSWPTVATVKSWIRQAERRKFVYTVKVCELITHLKRFQGTKELVKDFGYIADLLGPMMGCFLFQLPPSYRYSPARLKSILSQLDPARRNVVEFRHQSWWNEKVYSAFRNSGTIFCSCSGPRLPDELIKTADEIYIRFHGTKQWYRHNYTKAELAKWAERIHACGANRVWTYFNNDRDGNAIKNSQTLLRILKNHS